MDGMKILRSNKAISVVFATVLLMVISIGIFLSWYVYTPDIQPSETYATITGQLQENTIILEHNHGHSLNLDTKIILKIGGDIKNITTAGECLDSKYKADGVWNIGERIFITIGEISGLQVEVSVVDVKSNKIILSGILKEGYILGRPKGGIWHFNEGTGSIAYDSSGNHNHGTIYGTDWTTGISETALNFNGLNDYVTVPNSLALDITGNISVEAWMKPKDFIENIVNTSSFDTSLGFEPDIIHVSDDIYAIAYRGPNDDGFVKTLEITSNGDITDITIDKLEFDTLDCYNPKIIQIKYDTYAIAYRSNDSDGFVKTIRIASNGIITDTIIDALEFDALDGFEPSMIHVSGDVYAIAYRGPDDDGFVKTIGIASNGIITDTIIDALEFDALDGFEPSMIHVSGDVYALAYRGPDDDGFVKTIEIASNGDITDTIIDALEFDTVEAYEPNMIHVSGDVYAIAYIIKTNLQGDILTIEIASDGQITDTIMDKLLFESTKCYEPDIIHVIGDIYAIAYRGSPSHVGYVKLIDIGPNGQIVDSVIDEFMFDEHISYEPDMIHISGGIFALVFRSSPAHDGYITTIRASTNPYFSGINKMKSFGISASTTTAFGIINDQMISGAISPGWNYIVLTYDMSDIRLYSNGTEIASKPYNTPINTNNNDLLFGYTFYGIIDEVAVYDKILSPTEILDRYNSLKP
jgi:hypothetical protein